MIRSIRPWLGALLLACSVPLLAAEPRPKTHEDVWTMQCLGTPAVSPDGRHAALSVTEPSCETDGEVSDL